MWIKYIILLSFFTYFVSSDLVFPEDVVTRYIGNALQKNQRLVNHKCASQISKTILDLLEKKKWAFQMLDASSKIPSGVLAGNLIDLGSFDQCIAIEEQLDIENEKQLVEGNFCLLSISIKNLLPNMKSNQLQKTSLPDMAGFAPEVRVINLVSPSPLLTLSICVPSGCDENYLNALIGSNSSNSLVHVSSCQTKHAYTEYNVGDWCFIAFMIIIVVAMILSTFYDIYLEQVKKRPAHLILVTFSVYSNGKKLFSTNKTPNQLPCLNGIRFLSMMWVIFGHSFYTTFYSPTINTIYAMEWMQKIMSMTIIGATISVDTFFVLGGLVMVYSFMLGYEKGIRMNVIVYYIHRYIRLTPALAVAMCAHITVLRFLGSGPYWPSVMKALEVNCSKYWWSVLLYVQNYVNPHEQCMGQTWYLSVDMQLFLVSPLILFPLGKWPKQTLIGLVVLLVLSVISPFTIAYVDKLAGLIPLGTSNPNFMKMYYINTYARFGPWIVGIILGYYVHKRRENKRLNEMLKNKMINLAGWVASISVLLAVIYAPNTMFHHDYNRVESAIFLACHRVAWGVALAWIIYVCIIGQGGIINWFLSITPFQILARLTYSMYLIHLSLQFMRMGKMRVPKYFSDVNVIYEFWGDFCFTIALAVFWTLAFESPMIIIEKIIFGQAKAKPKEKSPILPTTEDK